MNLNKKSIFSTALFLTFSISSFAFAMEDDDTNHSLFNRFYPKIPQNKKLSSREEEEYKKQADEALKEIKKRTIIVTSQTDLGKGLKEATVLKYGTPNYLYGKIISYDYKGYRYVFPRSESKSSGDYMSYGEHLEKYGINPRGNNYLFWKPTSSCKH